MRVLDLLRGLSAELQTKINVLVFASMLLVIAKALFAHVRLGSHDKAIHSLILLNIMLITSFDNVFEYRSYAS